MSTYFNSPHSSWQNQTLSYWIPLRVIAKTLGVIKTASISILKMGKKWVGLDITSGRVD